MDRITFSSLLRGAMSNKSSAKTLISAPDTWMKIIGSTFSRLDVRFFKMSAKCSWKVRGDSRRP